MTTAHFIARQAAPPREIVADDGITIFSAILQHNALIIRLTSHGMSNKVIFTADDFVRQMAWLLDVEEDAA